MNNIQVNMINVKVSDLISKCRRKIDMIKFARELGMRLIPYNPIGYYFPQETGFDSKYFLEFLSGRKKVGIINNNYYSFFH